MKENCKKVRPDKRLLHSLGENIRIKTPVDN